MVLLGRPTQCPEWRGVGGRLVPQTWRGKGRPPLGLGAVCLRHLSLKLGLVSGCTGLERQCPRWLQGGTPTPHWLLGPLGLRGPHLLRPNAGFHTRDIS